MAKPVCVYSFDSNPAIDTPKFHVTHADAEIRVSRHHYGRLNRCAIIEPVPEGYVFDACPRAMGGFRSAWGIKPSGGMPVWQMRGSKAQITA